MDVDPKTAAEFGFPKLSYAALERERRWICDPPPPDLIIAAEVISDLYVGGAGLRLRKAEPTDGRQALFKLTRKRDLDSMRRLITTIYLEEPEHRFLSEVLSGERLQKRRHRLAAVAGAALAADEFLGPLRGLWRLEAEFEAESAMAQFTPSLIVGREVTDDARYTGAALARDGLP